MTSRRRAALVAAGLWLVSLFLPAAYSAGRTVPGAEVLATGWLGVVILQPGWCANPMLAGATLALFSHRRVWLAWAAVTALLALSALSWREVMDDSGTDPVTLGVGAYVWMAACCIPLAAWLLERRRTRERAA